jgi:hypothetical protein
MDDSAKTIHITKLSMLADQGKAAATSEMH